jgi:hypothetical protein
LRRKINAMLYGADVAAQQEAIPTARVRDAGIGPRPGRDFTLTREQQAAYDKGRESALERIREGLLSNAPAEKYRSERAGGTQYDTPETMAYKRGFVSAWDKSVKDLDDTKLRELDRLSAQSRAAAVPVTGETEEQEAERLKRVPYVELEKMAYGNRMMTRAESAELARRDAVLAEAKKRQG